MSLKTCQIGEELSLLFQINQYLSLCNRFEKFVVSIKQSIITIYLKNKSLFIRKFGFCLRLPVKGDNFFIKYELNQIQI